MVVLLTPPKGIREFSSQGRTLRSGFNTTPSKKRSFQKSSVLFKSLVSGFETSGSRQTSILGDSESVCSPAKQRRGVQIKVVQCSVKEQRESSVPKSGWGQCEFNSRRLKMYK